MRALGNRGVGAIGGHKAPIAGRVSMDLVTLDVSDLPQDLVAPDADARYERTIHVDAGEDLWEPQIACPHSVDHVQPLSALGEVRVEQAVLGSCTNGRLEDLEVAARIVAGRAVHSRTRLIVIPASRRISGIGSFSAAT
jgi:homoaconitase/3-isopropylmalate dehydratase large subunit